VRHVVLVGAMGSGKTTIGRQVAEALGRQFVDNDVALERRTGRTAAELAATDGVELLHRQEAAELLDALAEPNGSVIAAAASVVVDGTVRTRLGEVGWVVWLQADQATLTTRMPSSPDRPNLDPDAAHLVARQAIERDPLYQSVADVTFSTDTQTPEATVRAIIEGLPASLRPGTATSHPGRSGSATHDSEDPGRG
jgi:shikimate kinase